MLKIIEKTWNEFWAYYWRITQRHQIPGIFEWDKNLVNLIQHVCHLSPPMRILDLGCGGGDQAKLFAEKGYSVVGIDIAEPLIEHARESFKKNGLTGTFIIDDMRDIQYNNEFDLCTLLSGTFGFFDDQENFDLLKKIYRALKKNGKVFIMYVSPFTRQNKTKTWCEIDEGYQLSENWFDVETSTYRGTIRLIMNDGTILVPQKERDYHANEVIRCYTIPEIEGLLKNAHFEDIKHLSRKHIDNPDVLIKPWEIRDIAVATKR